MSRRSVVARCPDAVARALVRGAIVAAGTAGARRIAAALIRRAVITATAGSGRVTTALIGRAVIVTPAVIVAGLAAIRSRPGVAAFATFSTFAAVGPVTRVTAFATLARVAGVATLATIGAALATVRATVGATIGAAVRTSVRATVGAAFTAATAAAPFSAFTTLGECRVRAKRQPAIGRDAQVDRLRRDEDPERGARQKCRQ